MARYWIVLLGMLSFLVGGCTISTPAPVQVTVEVTSVVRETVVVPQTVIVRQRLEVQVPIVMTPTPQLPATATETPRPADTATPQPTATATLQPAPTATPHPGWKDYKDVTGQFTLQYPPEWSVRDQRAGAVSFALGSLGRVRYELVGAPLPVSDDKEQDLDNFVRSILQEQDPLDAVKVIARYVSSDTGALVVELAVDDHVDKSTYDEIYYATSVDDRHHARVKAWRIDEQFTADERKAIEEVPGTLAPRR